MTNNYYDQGAQEISTTPVVIARFPAGVVSGPFAVLKNVGSETVYLGSSVVTADVAGPYGGFPVEPGETIHVPVAPGDSPAWYLYGVTAEGTTLVSYLFVGVVY